MTIQSDVLAFYAEPGVMTSAGTNAAFLDDLPGTVEALAQVVQDLVIHELVADAFYGVHIPDDRLTESQFRRADQMLSRLLVLDAQPLKAARRPESRLVGTCHHFALLLVAMLRAKGIPARDRWGFAAYLNSGFFEDHVVCEYWNAGEARWAMADPQLDDVWRAKLNIDFDILDVPHDRFLIASDAWSRCRTQDTDASRFGIFRGDLRGLWFIACNLIKDVAALNKMEMLPWDVWGAMPRPDQPLLDDQAIVAQPHRLIFFDHLATLARDPDLSFDEIRARYESQGRLHVPQTVFNAMLNRMETLG